MAEQGSWDVRQAERSVQSPAGARPSPPTSDQRERPGENRPAVAGAPPRISVIMITGNVIANTPGRAIFERALQSVAWADELVIVDSESADETRAVAARYTSKLYTHPYRNSLKLQKKIALQHTTGEWILWVDADEILPPNLAAEIRTEVAAPKALGYKIRRCHYFAGKLLEYTGDDAPLRLWRNGVGGWDGPENEEVYVVPPPVGRLCTPLHHYSSANLALRLRKMAHFAPAHAAMAELPPSGDYTAWDVWRRIVKPSLQQFYGVYWIHRGYKDGVRGFIWAVLCAVGDFFNHILLWERAQRLEATAPAEADHLQAAWRGHEQSGATSGTAARAPSIEASPQATSGSDPAKSGEPLPHVPT